MVQTDQRLLPYQTIRRFERNRMLFTEVVPTEHAVSLPLPTRRWSRPTYAAFASPALYHPDQPVLQAAPDRWWAVDAVSGMLVLLASWGPLPFRQDHLGDLYPSRRGQKYQAAERGPGAL